MITHYHKHAYDGSFSWHEIAPHNSVEISPLQLAMQKNFLFIAKILVDKGANTSCLTDDEKKKLGIPVNLMANSSIDYSFYYPNNKNNNNNPFNPPQPQEQPILDRQYQARVKIDENL